MTIDAGANLERMKQNPENHQLVATGGKENDLKVWDLQQPDKPVFMAKNVSLKLSIAKLLFCHVELYIDNC